jgi:hypothetical protein
MGYWQNDWSSLTALASLQINGMPPFMTNASTKMDCDHRLRLKESFTAAVATPIPWLSSFETKLAALSRAICCHVGPVGTSRTTLPAPPSAAFGVHMENRAV